MKRASFSAALLALSQLAAAQVEIRSLSPLLANADQDEAREVAARYLAAIPDSPAHALRAWCRGGDWRRQVLLVRVLSERGELESDDVDPPLRSPHWPVRAAAARALGLAPELAGRSQLGALLRDPWAAVRREALLALHRRRELTPRMLADALRDPRLRRAAAAIHASAPRAFAPVLQVLLDDPVLRDRVLARISGTLLDPLSRNVLRAYAMATRHPPAARCLALLALPREEWPVAAPTLLLESVADGTAGQSGPQRLASILDPKESARLLDRVFEETDPSRCRARLRLAGAAAVGSGAPVLRAFVRCPAEAREDALRLLVALRCPGLVEEAARVLAEERDPSVLLPWISQVGHRIAQREAERPLLVDLLEREPPIAAAAFQVLVAARQVGPAALEFATRAQAVRRTSRLLAVARRTPAEFWLPLLRRDNPRLRWNAAKALAGKAAVAPVRKALLQALYREEHPLPRGALLGSVLAGMRDEGAPGVISWVLERRDASLDQALVSWLENGDGGWVEAALRQLEGSRFDADARRIRAMRGDRAACRAVLGRVDEIAASKLRRLREPLARVLTREDMSVLERMLTGGGQTNGGRALPWVREEVVHWLRLRPELGGLDLLERVFLEDPALAVREASAAALVERGRTGLLMPLVDRWVVDQEEDAEGTLLEVLAALPPTLDTAQERFLVRLLIAPLMQDAVAVVGTELARSAFAGRVDALHPLLRQTTEAIARVPPARFEALLVRELRTRRVRRAWACASKTYLLRALLLAVRRPPAEIAMRPVLDWAMRLGPRPHEVDGALSLFAARAKERAGRVAEAARLWRIGQRELTLADVPAREVEQLAHDLVAGSSGPGHAVLEAKACILAAEQELAAENVKGARSLAARARFAAREDPGLRRVVARLRARIEALASHSGRGRR